MDGKQATAAIVAREDFAFSSDGGATWRASTLPRTVPYSDQGSSSTPIYTNYG